MEMPEQKVIEIVNNIPAETSHAWVTILAAVITALGGSAVTIITLLKKRASKKLKATKKLAKTITPAQRKKK